MNKRTRYPWNSLTEPGMSFPIENELGVKYIRQLIYAANKSQARKNSPNRFKAIKEGDKFIVKRIT